MSLAMDDRPARRVPVVLTWGFRPFFMAAGLWAAVAVAVWIVMLRTGATLPSRFDPLAWHIHEMLFGFVMAAVAGFLLTAIPNWTGRRPIDGLVLGVLAGLWLLGRIACLVSLWFPAGLAIAADLAFPIALLAVVAKEIVAAKNRRNIAMILPVAVLTIANLLMHLESIGVNIPSGLGWRLGLSAVFVLVSVIGGRIIPTFTRNWLSARQLSGLPVAHGPVDSLALGTLHAGLLAWALSPTARPVGVLLLVGAIFNLWRLARWHGMKTVAEPLLLVLHVGYGWLGIGAGLLGASILFAAIPESAGIHAMTVGAGGTMILAVMTRATRGHTGRILSADRITVIVYGLISIAAIARIAAEISVGAMMPLIEVSACFWVAAFLLFVGAYGRALLGPRIG